MRILGVGLEVLDQRVWMERMPKAQGKFIKENFSLEEIKYCSRKRNPWPHYSARWACKKAFLQALGSPSIKKKWMSQIEIKASSDGRPKIAIDQRIRSLKSDWEIEDIKISLSHTDVYSVAEVILLGEKKRK